MSFMTINFKKKKYSRNSFRKSVTTKVSLLIQCGFEFIVQILRVGITHLNNHLLDKKKDL